MGDLVVNKNIFEICWIVNQRNIWAKERKKLRNKHYRSMLDTKKTIEECAKLKLSFEEHNETKISLNQYTNRLRFLLKQEKLRLISDKNAGYSAIVPLDLNVPNFLISRTPWGKFNKEHIRNLALSFEASQVLERIIGD
jgi:hypothetical protein